MSAFKETEGRVVRIELLCDSCRKPFPDSIEQMCRNLIEQGISSGVCLRKPGVHPQELTASDLTGMANLLAEYLRENRK